MSDTASKRRWFRFSLRTLFLVVTVFGCWLGWHLHLLRERERLTEWIRARGGEVTTQKQTFEKLAQAGNPGHPSGYARPLPLLWRIGGVEPVRSIYLPFGKFSQEDAHNIRPLFPESDCFPNY